MASRKTFNVRDIIDRANYMLANPQYMVAPGRDRDMTNEEAFRMGVVAMLEAILFSTDNYKGFHYLEPWERGVTDETKRHYYTNRKLTEKDRS